MTIVAKKTKKTCEGVLVLTIYLGYLWKAHVETAMG